MLRKLRCDQAVATRSRMRPAIVTGLLACLHTSPLRAEAQKTVPQSPIVTQAPSSPPATVIGDPAARDAGEPADPVFAGFLEWAARYAAATQPTAKAQLEPAGVALATQRRKVLKQLIISDPQRALDLAVPFQVRRALPAAVIGQLEQPISARGEFMVLAIDNFDPQSGAAKTRILRSLVVGGQAYHAHVYGRRLGVTSKNEIAAHGILLDRDMAVHQSPVRVIEAGETPDPAAPAGNPDKLCPICGADASHGIVADVGGKLYYFDKAADLQEFTARIEKQEDIIDPAANGL